MIETNAIEPSGASRNQRRRPRKAVRGLTLIEILVVVTILGLIASIVGVTVANQLEEAKLDAAAIQLKEFGTPLDLYKIRFNRYPTTAEGLQALTKPPKGKPLMDMIPKDPWDADFIYISPGQHSTTKYDLQSKGPDGVADTADDVKSW